MIRSVKVTQGMIDTAVSGSHTDTDKEYKYGDRCALEMALAVAFPDICKLDVHSGIVSAYETSSTRPVMVPLPRAIIFWNMAYMFCRYAVEPIEFDFELPFVDPIIRKVMET